MTEDILQDSKESSLLVGGGCLLDCPYCYPRSFIIIRYHFCYIAKVEQTLMAVLKYHWNQEINLPYLRSKFTQFLNQNGLPIKFTLRKPNQHLAFFYGN